MNSIPIDNINLCFVGGVSTGKSTILNAIFCEELTQCKIKRTTMVPTVYVENGASKVTPDEIYKKITEKNKDIIERTERGEKIDKDEYKEMEFQVGPLDINILEGSRVNVYDIPGLNDARTKDVYYEYLDANFFKFNVVIFIVDIHSGLNTSDEIDIVNFITNNTRDQLENNGRKIYTLVVVNKADDMQIDDEGSDVLRLTGELSEMYDQVKTTITCEFEKKNISEHLIGIVPLCAVDAYLYRMVKKHGTKFKLSPEQILKIGVNENGKKFSTMKPDAQSKKVYESLTDKTFIDTMIRLSGFRRMERILNEFLTKNNYGKKIRIDNLLYSLRKLPNVNTTGRMYTENQRTVVEQYYAIYDEIRLIDNDMYILLMVEFTEQLCKNIETHVPMYSELTSLFTDYELVCKHILNPMFYDANIYAEYFTDRVFKIIHVALGGSFTVKSFAEQLSSVIKYTKQLDKFDYKTVTHIINSFMENLNGVHTVNFIDSSKDDVHLLCKVLAEIPSGYDVGIKLYRFLIMNQLASYRYSADDLYLKKMMYIKHGELPLANYINFDMMGKPSLKCIINGLTEYETDELDSFYLKRGLSDDSCNYVNTDDAYHNSNEEEEEELKFEVFTHSGKTYLIDKDDYVYDKKTHVRIGEYNGNLDIIV